MKHIALLALLVLSFTGCGSLQSATGDYVIDAVTQQVSAAIDTKLNERNLSLEEIKNAADLDGSGDVTQEEMVASARLAVQDMVVAKLGVFGAGMQEQIKAATEDMVTADSLRDVQSDGQSNLWALVLAVVGYLTKQVFSAKSDGKRDARLAVMEKMLGKDLDGDGVVGDAAA